MIRDGVKVRPSEAGTGVRVGWGSMVETAQSHPLAAAQSDPLTIDATAVGVDTGDMDYQPRVIDAQLAAALEAAGAVVIEGPKACGKTETARQASRSEVRIDTLASRQAMAVSPELLLEGPTPRILDE